MHTGAKPPQGCSQCAKDSWVSWSRDTTETFIKKAKKKHGNKYSYEKVNYTLSQVKVVISCGKHDDFEQRPNTHLRGAGARAVLSKLLQKNNEKALKNLLSKHRDYINLNIHMIV
jgi:hypothetical protein